MKITMPRGGPARTQLCAALKPLLRVRPAPVRYTLKPLTWAQWMQKYNS